MQDTAIVVPPREAGGALQSSLADALDTLVAAVPRLLGFVLVLIIGWFIASLLARGVGALLRAINFNDLAQRAGLARFVQNMGVKTDASGVLAGVVKWFVRLIALVVAFDVLGLPAVSVVLQQLLLWLPNLIVALVVLVIGGLAAEALARVVRGSTAQAGFTNPDILATVARFAVLAFAVVVAVNQLGIATDLINILMVGIVGALALASGLAFGLGGRDRAAEILDGMGRGGSGAGPRLDRSAGSNPEGRWRPNRGNRSPDDEGWVQRTGYDRRRVSRPGPDRREGEPAAG